MGKTKTIILLQQISLGARLNQEITFADWKFMACMTFLYPQVKAICWSVYTSTCIYCSTKSQCTLFEGCIILEKSQIKLPEKILQELRCFQRRIFEYGSYIVHGFLLISSMSHASQISISYSRLLSIQIVYIELCSNFDLHLYTLLSYHCIRDCSTVYIWQLK